MAWSKTEKPIESWGKSIKPTESFTKSEKQFPLDNFLFQNGDNYLFQNGDYFVFEDGLTTDYDKTAKP